MQRRRVGSAVYESARWERVRRLCLERSHYICEMCGRAGNTVHHKIPLTADNLHIDAIAYGLDNLQCLCPECHNKVHDRFKAGAAQEGKQFDSAGNVIVEVDAEFEKARRAIEAL